MGLCAQERQVLVTGHRTLCCLQLDVGDHVDHGVEELVQLLVHPVYLFLYLFLQGCICVLEGLLQFGSLVVQVFLAYEVCHLLRDGFDSFLVLFGLVLVLFYLLLDCFKVCLVHLVVYLALQVVDGSLEVSLVGFHLFQQRTVCFYLGLQFGVLLEEGLDIGAILVNKVLQILCNTIDDFYLTVGIGFAVGMAVGDQLLQVDYFLLQFQVCGSHGFLYLLIGVCFRIGLGGGGSLLGLVDGILGSIHSVFQEFYVVGCCGNVVLNIGNIEIDIVYLCLYQLLQLIGCSSVLLVYQLLQLVLLVGKVGLQLFHIVYQTVVAVLTVQHGLQIVYLFLQSLNFSAQFVRQRTDSYICVFALAAVGARRKGARTTHQEGRIEHDANELSFHILWIFCLDVFFLFPLLCI